jgi:hypothetical protein
MKHSTHYRSGIIVALLASIALLPASAFGQEASLPALLDPIPEAYRQRLAEFESDMRRESTIFDRLFDLQADSFQPFFVILPEDSRWPADGTVTVAFLGGSDFLRARIETVAQQWLDQQDITLKLSFRDDRDDYREWSRRDLDYRGHIRIAFDLKGYWSSVGNASRLRSLVGPHEASMSLAGFSESLPREWDLVILHEFGHALGFEHEHQHPAAHCMNEMKLNPDPGYIRPTDPTASFLPNRDGRSPGVLLYFGGPPDNWPEDKTLENLRTIKATVLASKFDKFSVMKYYFPEWLFKQGAQSSCFSEPSRGLSAGDQEGMLCFYSASPPEGCPEEPMPFTWSAAREKSFRSFLPEARKVLPQALLETLTDFEEAMQAMTPAPAPPPQ